MKIPVISGDDKVVESANNTRLPKYNVKHPHPRLSAVRLIPHQCKAQCPRITLRYARPRMRHHPPLLQLPLSYRVLAAYPLRVRLEDELSAEQDLVSCTNCVLAPRIRASL